MRSELTTDFLGLRLSSPVIVGACPMTFKPQLAQDLVIAGAGALVLPSLFQESLDPDRVGDGIAEGGWADQAGPPLAGPKASHGAGALHSGPEAYLAGIAGLKHRVGAPIIASLNGYSGGPWLSIATDLARAGADAVELSLSPDLADAADTRTAGEATLVHAVREVCSAVSVPVAVRLSPFCSSLADLASRLADAGAAGVVLFDREPQWEIGLDRLAATTRWPLSTVGSAQLTLSGLIRMRLNRPRLSVAASGGIGGPDELVRCLIAGADVAMVASEIYREGADAVAHMVEGLANYLNRHGLRSFEEFKQVRPEPVTRRDRARSDFPRSAGSPRAGDSDHNRDPSQQGHIPLASSD